MATKVADAQVLCDNRKVHFALTRTPEMFTKHVPLTIDYGAIS